MKSGEKKIREDLFWETHRDGVAAHTLTGRELFTMASDTSVVQKMEEAQMTTWPGHCSTHCFLGSCAGWRRKFKQKGTNTQVMISAGGHQDRVSASREGHEGSR